MVEKETIIRLNLTNIMLSNVSGVRNLYLMQSLLKIVLNCNKLVINNRKKQEAGMAEIRNRKCDIEARLAAEQTARDAEEARKKEIMEKIRRLEQEKAEYQDFKSAFMGMKGRMEEIISQINGLKARRLETDIYSFSGTAADTINTGVSVAQTAMGKRNSSFSNVELAAGVQIEQLSSYIVELEGKRSADRNEKFYGANVEIIAGIDECL